MRILDTAITAADNYLLPEELGFGQLVAPIMVEMDWENNQWKEAVFKPYGPIQLDPTAKVLHYAQEIFEGMKAYNINNVGPLLFRPEKNIQRFNFSAKRMAMPCVEGKLLLELIERFVSLCKKAIPNKSGESLYLRPFMIATEANLGVKPAKKYKFMIIASPSGNYFDKAQLTVMVERKNIRASKGGTGAAKTGGNYAASLLAANKAKDAGFMQTLWLDAQEHKYVEELSGMNFFVVDKGELITPPLTDTILSGITRESLITLAAEQNIICREEPIIIDDLLKKIKNGEISECFACGTAAVITPISEIGESDSTKYSLPSSPGPITQKLKQTLIDIQEGRTDGPPGWVYKLN